MASSPITLKPEEGRVGMLETQVLDAAFQCQMFLAVAFLNTEQYQAYTDGEEISDFLLLYFSGYIPYRANKLLLFILVLK
jgi:hypothetical protein